MTLRLGALPVKHHKWSDEIDFLKFYGANPSKILKNVGGTVNLARVPKTLNPPAPLAPGKECFACPRYVCASPDNVVLCKGSNETLRIQPTEGTIMNKKNKAAAILNASQKRLVGTAAAIGFDVATGYVAAVKLCRAIGDKSAGAIKALNDAGSLYKAGYVAQSLLAGTYAKRWGNMDRAQLVEQGQLILAKATPESSKADRRTEAEHKACRAADVSWSTAKRKADILPVKAGNRKPRPSANKKTPAKALPVDMVKASPKLASRGAANDYFATCAAALLVAVNKNAKHIEPRVSSAVSAFHDAMKAAGLIAPPAE